MFILPKLEAPQLPLTSENTRYNLLSLLSYLQSLVGYFYNCNAPVIEKDQVLAGLGFNPSTEAPVSYLFWPDAAPTNHMVYTHINQLYSGGLIVYKLYRRAVVVGGVAAMTYSIERIRDAAAITTLTSGNIFFTASDTNTHMTEVTLQTTSIIPGDIIRLTVMRDGTNGADTHTASLRNDGITISFL